jgi:hypothetical protein
VGGQVRDEALRGLDRQIEVGGTGDSIEHVQVVGEHARCEQRLAQLDEVGDTVIDAAQQHCLVENRGFRRAQGSDGGAHRAIDLARMVRMHDEDFLQRYLRPGVEERAIDALGQHDG